MFGACVRQLFSSILGIGQNGAGFRDLRIAPLIPQNLPWASGSIRTPAGNVAVAWKKEEDHIRFHLELPKGIPAVFVCGDIEHQLTQTVTDFVL